MNSKQKSKISCTSCGKKYASISSLSNHKHVCKHSNNDTNKVTKYKTKNELINKIKELENKLITSNTSLNMSLQTKLEQETKLEHDLKSNIITEQAAIIKELIKDKERYAKIIDKLINL